MSKKTKLKDNESWNDPQNPSKEPLHTLAVYGTLRRAWGNHRLIMTGPHEYLGIAKSVKKLRMVSKGVPFVFPNHSEKNGNNIIVEIYNLNHPRVRNLVDNLEGHPINYCRQIESFHLQEQDKTVKAWIYMLNHESDKRWLKQISPQSFITDFNTEHSNILKYRHG